MKTNHSIYLSLFTSVFLLAINFAAWAATPAGQVILAVGKLEAIGSDQTTRSLQRGTAFYQEDTLVTGGDSQAKLRFTDGTLITLNPNSRIRVDSYHYQAGGGSNNSYIVSLTTGGFRTVSGAIAKEDSQAYQVRTPVATIAIRGTDYSVAFNRGAGLVTAVWSGVIALTNDSGTLLIGEQQKFHYAQIKSLYAVPEGLTQMPKTLINSAAGKISTPTTPPQEETAGLGGKSELLEICIP
jgi:ferric-dicitrate binding protein FerR (iron transport regulator)